MSLYYHIPAASTEGQIITEFWQTCDAVNEQIYALFKDYVPPEEVHLLRRQDLAAGCTTGLGMSEENWQILRKTGLFYRDANRKVWPRKRTPRMPYMPWGELWSRLRGNEPYDGCTSDDWWSNKLLEDRRMYLEGKTNSGYHRGISHPSLLGLYGEEYALYFSDYHSLITTTKEMVAFDNRMRQWSVRESLDVIRRATPTLTPEARIFR